MKPLASLKQKKRYIVFQTEPKQSKEDLQKAVKEALRDFLGVLGVAKAAPLFAKYKNGKFILKINHKYVDEAKSAVILIKTIKNNEFSQRVC